MPIDEVKRVFEKYKKESEALSTEDDFFSEIRGLQGNSKDSQFNMLKGSATTMDESDFFKEFSNTKNDKKAAIKESEF